MKKLITFGVILGLSLLIASCGGGGGGGGASTSINVTMTDFQFTPRTFTVPAGKEITLNAVNNGARRHNFVIMKLGQTAGDKFDDQDVPNVFWQVEVNSGESTSATFTAPTEPGSYQVLCKTPGHLTAGMTATLTVIAGQ